MIIKIDDLKFLRDDNPNKKIVLCHGVFDIFHYGHLVYLTESRNFGDILVVSLTSDKFVVKKKNTIFQEKYRIEIINSLKIVDFCCISPYKTAIEIIEKLKPDVYSKGSDVKGKELNKNENLYCEYMSLQSYGGKLVFIKEKTGFHTTNILNIVKE